jgi:hypothetical protein
VKQSIELGDHHTLALLIGLCLSETLLTRCRREAWIAATLHKLRETILPEDKRGVPGVQFLTQALADSQPFKQIAEKVIAPGSAAPGTKHPIETVALDLIPAPDATALVFTAKP